LEKNFAYWCSSFCRRSNYSKKSIQGIQNTAKVEPYHALVLSNIQQIKTAEFTSNTMDDAGYYHYVLVNEVLKDPALSTIPPSELSAVALLEKINQVEDNKSDVYYATLYPFENKEDFAHFKPIAKIYTTTFFRLNNTALFTAYSKEMEAAVLTDATLSQHVKDILLLEMATYRFGNTYYFSKF